MKAKILDFVVTVNKKQRLTLEFTEDFTERYDNLKDCTVSVEIKKYRKGRTLDANAYFWVLCGKLAAGLGQPKENIYRELIKDMGDNYRISPIKTEEVEQAVYEWGKGRLGWVCEVVGESKLNGYTNIKFYKGSSVYDTAQMARLIDLIVYECKEQDIETLTPEKLSLLKGEWK